MPRTGEIAFGRIGDDDVAQVETGNVRIYSILLESDAQIDRRRAVELVRVMIGLGIVGFLIKVALAS